MSDRPSIKLLKRAFGDRLESDAMLLDLIFNRAAYSGGVPGTWRLLPYEILLPCLEYGIQTNVDDPRNGYGQRGLQILMRLMVHDHGPEPGYWDFERSYDILERCDTVLTATPLAVSGQSVWRFWLNSGINETTDVDANTGLVYTSVGAIYEIRTYKT